MRYQILVCGLIACLFAGCAGKPPGQFIPISGNFGYVGHVSGAMDRSLREGLCYRAAGGNATVVWIYLQMVAGNNIVCSNDTAVFVGGISSLYKDGNERLSDRLMAFKGPSGPPMDITDQVLMRYYTGTGMSLTNFMRDSFNTLTITNGSVRILFASDKLRAGTKDIWDPFDSVVTLSWQDIEAIMADTQANGKLKKEKWSGVEYLRNE
jgi:hypothetical protein